MKNIGEKEEIWRVRALIIHNQDWGYVKIIYTEDNAPRLIPSIFHFPIYPFALCVLVLSAEDFEIPLLCFHWFCLLLLFFSFTFSYFVPSIYLALFLCENIFEGYVGLVESRCSFSAFFEEKLGKLLLCYPFRDSISTFSFFFLFFFFLSPTYRITDARILKLKFRFVCRFQGGRVRWGRVRQVDFVSQAF